MSYPTLQLSSDANLFRVMSHNFPPGYDLNVLADSCRKDCGSNTVPALFQRLGQRQACCGDPMITAACAQPISTTSGNLLPAFVQGNPKSASHVREVDNLTGQFCGYQRNARYTGTLGGATHY